MVGLGNFEKLEYEGIPEDIVWLADDVALGGQLEDVRLLPVGGEAEEEGGFDLALQFPDRPFLPRALLLVKAALQRVVELQQLDDVGPAQKVRQRRTFWVGKVELAGADDVASAEAFAVAEAEVTAQVGDQGLAVGGTGLAALLVFHDVMPDLPKSPGEVLIHRPVRLQLTMGVNRRNSVNQGLIAGILCQLEITHSRVLSSWRGWRLQVSRTRRTERAVRRRGAAFFPRMVRHRPPHPPLRRSGPG